MIACTLFLPIFTAAKDEKYFNLGLVLTQLTTWDDWRAIQNNWLLKRPLFPKKVSLKKLCFATFYSKAAVTKICYCDP